MPTLAVSTIVKMMESLPEHEQDRVVNHLRDYILDIQDELQWDKQFQKSQVQLISAVKKARYEVSNGKAKQLNSNDL